MRQTNCQLLNRKGSWTFQFSILRRAVHLPSFIIFLDRFGLFCKAGRVGLVSAVADRLGVPQIGTITGRVRAHRNLISSPQVIDFQTNGRDTLRYRDSEDAPEPIRARDPSDHREAGNRYIQ